MFSQNTIDNMDIDELADTIKSITNEIKNRIYDPEDALIYSQALENLANSMTSRIENYIEYCD